MLNNQAPEKRVVHDGSALAVNSIFHTIQGEGPFAGMPSVFVRLAGCNLQCPMCDTEYTMRNQLPIIEIIHGISIAVPEDRVVPMLVVITGGEPFRQPIGPLVRELLLSNFKVQIETNGSLFCQLPFHNPDLTIVCSPKTGLINRELMPYIKALKYVASAESLEGSKDGLPSHALEHPNSGMLARPVPQWAGEIYLQPVDEQDPVKNKRNLDAVLNSCFEFGHRLCIQTHKLIGVP